ncbi:MAG TPA: PAS domain-containing sensor histidine kinase [Polyangia bacterium]|nr:PAS domain-containing sensor histidine kinase [Polyangia bacterium]
MITRGRPAQRARIEEASSLKESDERFRVLVDSIRDYAVFMLDRDGRVQTWNTGAALIKGYRREEIIGKPIDLFYTREDRQSGRPARLLAQAADEGRVEDEGWRVRKDGTRFWADVVITALRNEAGALVGFAKVTRDLTQRQQDEAERRRLETDRIRAEEALHIRDEFLSVASHELKTPLTALQIELYGMRALLEKEGDERFGSKLTRASRSADRLSRLIEMLLDVSRIATGRLTLTREPFDLRPVMEQVVETMQGIATQAGCDFSFDSSVDAGAIVGCWDRLRIEQVVMNLLSNAFKFGAGRPVTLSVSRDGDEATIELRDHGPGIPAGDLERIFERFERAAGLGNHSGLGLGLYVSREIVQAHGGSIAAQTLSDGGARFTVRLPLAARK